ncbi:PilZ domain-containing protein [Cellvibrio japonicus]|uniref:PilZ domain-containing protein n=1 Tax=Cellvibrio japonicus (strain Ueda107) TaxID=498211 RepID=B3PJI2_CELJU|nr:PilZ domain-containing protein [Cellvibrio japonicus]ACE83926.1 hypothetical protein CJA_0588 [Cellvibrio japonicus Ueda107]QEI11269.1 PilZ domain-containing protein [Cellvibrio japonicus]QEI14843.1 PilZ domain-containing protein [Cellvibrio japonicus]QEI18423.1 PilZ domain-containing protein [Cellvibrio japonicus]
MRSFIRHPTSIPIQLSTSPCDSMCVNVRNLSAGGVCFLTDEPVKVGDKVDFWIPHVRPEYQGKGVVVWRRDHKPKGYEVGVRFTSDDEYFRVRMVEQVCCIEDYRQRLALKGRQLSSEAAAQEWIEKYAGKFDQRAMTH